MFFFFFKGKNVKKQNNLKMEQREAHQTCEKERPESAKQKKFKQKEHPPLPNTPQKNKKPFNTKLLTFNIPKKNYL